ncbi:hypothetical protein [Algicella marina]|uniref:Uncharacterized protein n=1 Tax=Algicella marina TaxID=2683284 RepID=A0A6P1T3B9_9RHOB|nr:hypothetical protein [Algicella marina]QHQ36261.1 hypothetical protein GO499_14315 [Algicella marina]
MKRSSIVLGAAMMGSAGLLAACDAPMATTDDGAAPAATATAAAPAAEGGATPMPPSLTSDERVIWNSLTEDARREAAAYIRNGGTLTQFVAI